MILDQFGQPARREFSPIMLAPPRLDPVAAGNNYDVDNSSGKGIFMFGGWIFPIEASADRGHIKEAIRDDNGDTYLTDDEYASTIDPPDYTLQTIVHSVSESWTAGNGIYGSSTNCANISNGCRIEKNAGVSATFSFDITIKINAAPLGPNTCPGGGGPSGTTFWSKRYTSTVTFSG